MTKGNDEQLDEEYLKVLQLLKHNPRRSFLKISRITGIPVERVYEIYYDMYVNNLIKTITILEKNQKINVLLIFIPSMNPEKTLEYLENNIYVNSISLTDREFIVHLSFNNFSEYDSLLDVLEFFGAHDLKAHFIREVIL
ncbi:MAG: hypothetical protein KatS3mg002_0941 [Candidatus Woesearchaeota archaeon]|nr:MAG: hypothetical protein KatS3mg002_0941 [Candidatus Woesearchaeota archaeon]